MKNWIAAALLTLSCALAGCAAEPVDDSVTASTSAELSTAAPSDAVSSTDPNSAALPMPRCCSYGFFSCSTNPDVFEDYDPPGCGEQIKPTARAHCVAQCGHACIDSGWRDSGMCPGDF